MLTVIRPDLWVPEEVKQFNPRSELGKYIKTILHFLPAEQAIELLDRISSCLVIESSLYGKVFWKNGKVEDLGLLGTKSITDAGVGFFVDAWQNSVEMEIMKYHGLGTGTTAEATSGAGSTLVTELTTEYTGDVRATGTTTEASALVFQSVATNTLDGTPGAALREHAIVSTASGAHVTWDRTLFAAITLSSGDGLQTTYNMTGSAGG